MVATPPKVESKKARVCAQKLLLGMGYKRETHSNHQMHLPSTPGSSNVDCDHHSRHQTKSAINKGVLSLDQTYMGLSEDTGSLH